MAINKAMRKVLKKLSYGDIEVETSRRLANLKALDPLKRFYKKIDQKIYNEGHEVPVRIYPSENDSDEALLYLHGGGWITESVETYDRICAALAKATGQTVVSVEYRLAPEFRFPTALEDCYAVAKSFLSDRELLHVAPEKLTLIGDSAGGNLAAALSLMLRDKGMPLPKKQILIYPAVNNDYTEHTPFLSVKENGEDFLLTQVKLCQYQELYKGAEEDLQNPYFAPILAQDLSRQPSTLIITAEYDPLRDEGEEYGRRLQEAGNQVEIHRIKDALHGFFALGIKYFHVQESFEIINHFLKEE